MLGVRLSLARERAMHDSSTSIPNPGGVTGVAAAYPGRCSTCVQLHETVSALFCCEPTFVLSPLKLLTQYVGDWRGWVDPKQVRHQQGLKPQRELKGNGHLHKHSCCNLNRLIFLVRDGRLTLFISYCKP